MVSQCLVLEIIFEYSLCVFIFLCIERRVLFGDTIPRIISLKMIIIPRTILKEHLIRLLANTAIEQFNFEIGQTGILKAERAWTSTKCNDSSLLRCHAIS